MVNDYGYTALGFNRDQDIQRRVAEANLLRLQAMASVQQQAAQASLAQQALNGHQQWYELYSANRPLEREDGPW